MNLISNVLLQSFIPGVSASDAASLSSSPLLTANRPASRMQLLVTVVVLIGLLSPAAAQELTVKAEYRINPVYSRGFREPFYAGDKPGFFTMQRSRLMVNYKNTGDLETEFILQDRRFWGEGPDRSDIPSVTIFRAWAEKHFTSHLSLRLGRQGFAYDDGQILTDPNWAGTRAHDAALLKYKKKSFEAHLAAAYSSNGQDLKQQYYQPRLYRDMEFLWIKKNIGNSLVSLIFLNRGMQKTDTTVAYSQTFGPYAEIQLAPRLLFKGLFYYQMGEDTYGRKMSAYIYSLQLFYKINDWLEINPGLDVTSGTDQSQLENPANTHSYSFDKLYGLHHGKFGYIDYFYINDFPLTGIHDYYVKAEATVAKAFTIENHLHSFSSSAIVNNAFSGAAMNKYLGIENDILLTYKLSPTFKATLGHSIMFGTPTLDHLFGGRESIENQVIYAVVTITTPTITVNQPK